MVPTPVLLLPALAPRVRAILSQNLSNIEQVIETSFFLLLSRGARPAGRSGSVGWCAFPLCLYCQGLRRMHESFEKFLFAGKSILNQQGNSAVRGQV